MNNNNQINGHQFFLILIHSQIGVGMITLANDVHLKAKSDSWISALIAGVFIQCLIFLFGALIHRFPGSNLFEMIEIVIGKVLGKILTFLYCWYFIVSGAILFAKYTIILKSWMLPLTPKWVLISALGILTVYLAIDNLVVISRFFILASLVLVIFLGFVTFSLKDANYTYIMPVGVAGFQNILQGAWISSLSYQGFEYALFFAPFVLTKKNTVVKTMTFTNIFTTLFYTFTILATQLFFSPNELKLIPEPVFYLVKSFSFKVIERPDLLFTSLWLVLVVTSTVVLFFITSFTASSLFKNKKRTPHVFITVAFSLILSLCLKGEDQIAYFSNMYRPFFFVFSIIIPVLILLFSYIFRKSGGEQ